MFPISKSHELVIKTTTSWKTVTLIWVGLAEILFFYEVGSFFISPLRRKGARLMGSSKLKILDIATGTGAHALEMAKLGHAVTGIDLDQNMLKKANLKLSSNLHLEFYHADATRLPFLDQEFEAATISFAMHDVPFEIGQSILLEASRIIKPDGFIFIIDYQNPKNTIGSKILYNAARFYESPHYFPFVNTTLSSYLDSLGLVITESYSFAGAVQFTKIAKSTTF